MKTFATITLAAFAFTAALAAPVSAAAPASAKVAYGDLNLSSEKGRAILDRRIERAVANVCGGAARDLDTKAAIRACKTTAMKSAAKSRDLAVAAYANPRLTAKGDKVIRLVVN